MNDPNGLCFWKGKWHLFFQGGSPEATQPSWGHAVSTDLIHWQDLPYAIEPGPELASYSGATWVEEDRVIAMYHGVNLGNMIAVSGETDLIHWEKLTNNAVIAQPCPFFTTTNGTETICLAESRGIAIGAGSGDAEVIRFDMWEMGSIYA